MPRKKADPAVDEPQAVNEIPQVPMAVIDPSCGRCWFRVSFLPRVPNAMAVLRCHRFPQAVEISGDDHWCGEYRHSEVS